MNDKEILKITEATRDSGHRTMSGSGAGYSTIALAKCPLGMGDGSVENYHPPSSDGTFRVLAPKPPQIYRWIEAKWVWHQGGPGYVDAFLYEKCTYINMA